MNEIRDLKSPQPTPITTPPVVLSFSTLDPSGRAGIQADIETSASLHCHCAPIATALCSSGNSMEADVLAIDSPLLIEQARSLLEDLEIAVISIGYLGSVENAEAVHAILNDYPSIPVVMQANFCLLDEADDAYINILASLNNLIVPHCSVLIATDEEVQQLSSSHDSLASSVQALLDDGPDNILVSRTDMLARCYTYTLYDSQGSDRHLSWDMTKLTPSCLSIQNTLGAAIACYIAHGSPLPYACQKAISFAQSAAQAAWQLGFEKPTPNRFYWVNRDGDNNKA